MIRFPGRALVVAALFGTGLLAQQTKCAHLRARTVPEAQTISGLVSSCGSVRLTIGGLTVQGPSSGCPAFIIHTPEHEIIEHSPHRTWVTNYGQRAVTTFRFECQTDWFILIPIGSSCRHVDMRTSGTVDRWVTRNCDEEPEREIGA